MTDVKRTMNYSFQNPDLPLDERLNDLVSRLTLDEKIKLIPSHQQAIERLGIDQFIIGGEAAHGIAWLGEATSFPQPIGMACSWNPDLIYQVGKAIANEARVFYEYKLDRKQGLTLWAPTVDLERDPRWGRTEEGYGEDPVLVSQMGRAFVLGMQGEHPHYKQTVSTIKHYMGNNNEKDRLISSSNIDNRNKMEYYTKPFRNLIIDDGAYSIMPAYNEVNGIPCIVDPDLNRLIKQEWGLQGYIVSDATDMTMLVDFHHFCSTYAEAVALTLKHGVDSVNDDAELVIEAVKKAIQEGLLDEVDLNQAIKNTLKCRFQLGQFDAEESSIFQHITEAALCCPEHSQLSLQMAKESIVLLKNSHHILPIQEKAAKKIAVLGPLSDQLYRDWYSGTFPVTISPLQGIRYEAADSEVVHHRGSDLIAIRSRKNGNYLYIDLQDQCRLKAGLAEMDDSALFEVEDWGNGAITLKSYANKKYLTASKTEITATAEEIGGWFVKEIFGLQELENGTMLHIWNGKRVEVDQSNGQELFITDLASTDDAQGFEIEIRFQGISNAVKLAESSDYAIVCVGSHPMINGKEDCDRPSLLLPSAQAELIRAVCAVNPNTIVCVISGYPFTMSDIHNSAPAILYSAHGSQELGKALAEVIFGEYAPAGRLPMTWYASEAQLPDIMDYDIIQGKRTYMYFDGEPLYPFGYGLTYAEFEYSELRLASTTCGIEDNVEVNFLITNTGSMTSDEVVQLYVSMTSASVARPNSELKAFKRVQVNAGETASVTLLFPVQELAFWDVSREKFCVESGKYEIKIGSSSQNIKLFDTITVEGEVIPERDLTVMTKAENYDWYQGVTLHKRLDGSQFVVAGKEAWIRFDRVKRDAASKFVMKARFTREGGSLEFRENSPEGQLLSCFRKTAAGMESNWELCEGTLLASSTLSQLYILISQGTSLEWFHFQKGDE